MHAITSALFSEPQSSNVLVYGAVWSLSGVLFLGKVTTDFKVFVSNKEIVQYQAVQAVLLNKVVPKESVVYFSSIPSLCFEKGAFQVLFVSPIIQQVNSKSSVQEPKAI